MTIRGNDVQNIPSLYFYRKGRDVLERKFDHVHKVTKCEVQ